MSRKNRLFILVLILSFFLCSTSGYSWPFGNKKEKKTTPVAAAKPAAAAAAKPAVIKKTVVAAPIALRSQDLDEEEFDEEEEEEAPLIPELPQIPQLPKIPNVRPLSDIPTGVPVIPGMPDNAKMQVSGQDPEIERIKKQIQDIIKINESLKSNYAGQAAEIQKISEQARIHQRLLKDLEAAKAQQQSAPPASEKYLNEEKIRLIQKETEKNQKFLDTLQTQDVSKGIHSTGMPDQEARKS